MAKNLSVFHCSSEGGKARRVFAGPCTNYGTQTAHTAAVWPLGPAAPAAVQEPVSEVTVQEPPGTDLKETVRELQAGLTRFKGTLLWQTELVCTGGPAGPCGPAGPVPPFGPAGPARPCGPCAPA